jgi:predicted amidohydrolase YtcJ
VSGTLLLTGGEVGGRRRDIRVDGRRVVAVGALDPLPGERVLAVDGGAVLPGLHDHHVHLRALAAARTSLDLTGVAAVDRAVRAAVAGLPRGTWLRAVGWHGSGLDRAGLDAAAPDHPVRVQHRTGALWVLNSAALARLGIERSTGELWREDTLLFERIGSRVDGAALAEVSAEGLRRGVTGYTDATPGRTGDDLAGLPVRQRVLPMAEPGVPGLAGPVKTLLDDADLPAPAALRERFEAAHARGRAVAVHCVTADQLALALGVLEQAGTVPGDRIEHAAVVPPGFAARLRALRLTVVTQPAFAVERGADYLREVPAEEVPWLWPCRSLIEAGVAVAAGTDAPYGTADPWAVIAAATRRTLNPAERVDAGTALRLFLGDPLHPGAPRSVSPGQPADLCVLAVPLAAALAEPDAGHVRGTVIGGEPAWWA